jgi:hypothetical protein
MADFNSDLAIEAAIARKSEREREDEARYQAEQRAKLQLPTELDTRAQLGARMVSMAQTVLAEIDDDFEYSRMAEGYALQGDYRKAALLTRDADRRKEYQVLINAMDTPTECGCLKNTGKANTQFVKDKILFEGQVRHVVVCTACRHVRC